MLLLMNKTFGGNERQIQMKTITTGFPAIPQVRCF
jgi:hypothetical protein